MTVSVLNSTDINLIGQLSLEKQDINQKLYKICLILYFEADFLWKVGLKILNSAIILKTLTHGSNS